MLRIVILRLGRETLPLCTDTLSVLTWINVWGSSVCSSWGEFEGITSLHQFFQNCDWGSTVSKRGCTLFWSLDPLQVGPWLSVLLDWFPTDLSLWKPLCRTSFPTLYLQRFYFYLSKHNCFGTVYLGPYGTFLRKEGVHRLLFLLMFSEALLVLERVYGSIEMCVFYFWRRPCRRVVDGQVRTWPQLKQWLGNRFLLIEVC